MRSDAIWAWLLMAAVLSHLFWAVACRALVRKLRLVQEQARYATEALELWKGHAGKWRSTAEELQAAILGASWPRPAPWRRS